MLVEMSYPLSPDAPVFPGVPLDEVFPLTRMSAGDVNNTTTVRHFLHNGTHVDAPFHFYDRGLTIDRLPVEDFCYTRALVVDKTLGKGQLLQVPDLEACGQALYSADILLLCTGYHALRSNKAVYADDFPALSVEAARFIRNQLPQVKALAIDTLSIESCVQGPRQVFPVHKALLDSDQSPARPVLIFEDANLGAVLKKEITRIYAFPLRLTGLDGSPVAMVAEVA